jgi:hypothetical protein
MENRSRYFAAVSLLGWLVAGCATTTPIVSVWRNPDYAAVSFTRIMVGGLGGEISTRRLFEDEFIDRLRAAGIDSVASYRLVSDVGAVDESKIKDAARKAGAEVLILARSVRVEEGTEYSGSYLPPASWFGIFGSHGGVSVSGLGGVPSASRYIEYTTETTLLDVAKNEVVWTATAVARERASGESAVKSTVDAVLKALAENNYLRRPQQ